MKTRNTTVDGVEVPDLIKLASLIEQGKLYDMKKVAKLTDRCVRYLRRLCHEKKVDHHKILGRYYMTQEELGALVKPIKARGSN